MSRCNVCGIEDVETQIVNDRNYNVPTRDECDMCKECHLLYKDSKHWTLHLRIREKLIGKPNKEVKE